MDGFLDCLETLDMDAEAVFNVGFSVVEGRGGAGHERKNKDIVM